MASNKAVFERFHEATNSGDIDLISTVIDEAVAPEVLFHVPVPIEATGAQALKHVWTLLVRAFPDIHVTIEDMIAEGDKVVCRNTVTGTHKGEYRGIAPTGRSISYREIFIFRFADDRIAEIWGVVDTLSQLQQLGVAPR